MIRYHKRFAVLFDSPMLIIHLVANKFVLLIWFLVSLYKSSASNGRVERVTNSNLTCIKAATIDLGLTSKVSLYATVHLPLSLIRGTLE